MTQITIRGNLVSHALLELLGFRKPPLGLSGPKEITCSPDFKDAARSGDQGNPAELLFKRGQKFLGQPSCAKEPAALGAIFNFEDRFGHDSFGGSHDPGLKGQGFFKKAL